MFRSIFLLFSIIFSFQLLVNGQNVLLDKVIAKVGGEVILYSDLETNLASIQAKRTNNPASLRCDLLENIIMQKLLVNQAILDSVEVKEEIVDRELNARFDEILARMNNDPAFFEEYYGKSVAEKKESLRDPIRDKIMAEMMQNKVVTNVKITPEEVASFFNAIPKDSLPYFGSEVELSELLYVPQANKEEKLRIKAKLNDIRQQIIDGKEKFAEMAAKYSDDPTAASNNGDLGWQKRGAFVQEFEEAAYRLEEGQISEVVESPFGFHIIQLIERRGNNFHTQHILIKPSLYESDLQEAHHFLDSIRQQIVWDSMSFNNAVKRFAFKQSASYLQGGRMINQSTGNYLFSKTELDPDVFFSIDTMKINDISHPIEFKMPGSGEVAFRLIRLDNRTVPHKADIKYDYDKIKRVALEDKKSKEMNDWMSKKLENTYLWIDGEYNSCNLLNKWGLPNKNMGN